MHDGRKYALYHVDVFTDRPFAGNSAGVVPDATGLDEREMLAIAAELRHSETAFVLPPDGDDHDVIVRFFTPAMEVPSCGHATLATHFVRASRLGMKNGTVRQKCGAGVLRIDLEPDAGRLRVRMHQGPPRFVRELSSSEIGSLIEALGIGAGDRNPACPVEIVDTGHSKVLLGVRDSAVLNRIEPDSRALVALSRKIECNGFHVFTLAPELPGTLTECRMFAPAIGIAEDPVTGNGNGPLGAYLVRHGLAAHDGKTLRFESLQGRAMGRPGIANVEVTIETGTARSVSVAGNAVVVYRGEIELQEWR